MNKGQQTSKIDNPGCLRLSGKNDNITDYFSKNCSNLGHFHSSEITVSLVNLKLEDNISKYETQHELLGNGTSTFHTR